MSIKITKNGIIKDNIVDIRNDIKQKAIENVDGFSNLPSSIQNNLIDESAIIVNEFQDMIANLMNGISPAYANDYIINQLAEAFGVSRKDKQLQTVQLTFKGLAGTIIPAGTQVASENNEYIFETKEQTIIRSNGVATTTAIATDYYSKIIPAETLIVLINDILNIESVKNELQSSEPIEEETIEEFRSRLHTKCLANRNGTIALLDSKLKTIQGVNSRLCSYRNHTQRTHDGAIRPVIEVVVGGGDDYQVAEAIFESFFYPDIFVSSPSDDETDRTVNINVVFNSVSFPITFTRPKLKLLSISLTLTVEQGYINIPSEAFTLLLLPYFENYINNLKLGYLPTGYSFDNLIYKCFNDNNYNSDIIIGINYVITVDGQEANLNGKRQLETNFDIAYTLHEFKVDLNGASV